MSERVFILNPSQIDHAVSDFVKIRRNAIRHFKKTGVINPPDFVDRCDMALIALGFEPAKMAAVRDPNPKEETT